MHVARARSIAAAFLDGSSTPADEQWLYRFYSCWPAGSLPADLEQMRAMFAWYAGLPNQYNQTHVLKTRRNRLWWCVAAVITVLVVCAGGFALGLRRPGIANGGARYSGAGSTISGSYVIRNGQRNEKLPEIYDDIIAAERFADSVGRDSLAIVREMRSADNAEFVELLRKDLTE